MKNIKILIDGRLISNKPTGISRVTLELIKSYELRYGKQHVSVICNDDFSEQFNTIVTKLKPFNIYHFIKFSFLLRKLNPDVYHSPYYSGSLFKVKNTIQILDINDLMFYKVEGFFSANKLINLVAKIYYVVIVWLSLRSANIILSISNTTKEDLKKIFGFDSTVINLGISTNDNGLLTGNDKRDILEKIGVSKNDYLLYVGNNRRHKNINFLVEAYKKSYTPLKLLLVGFNDKELVTSTSIINKASVTDDELDILYENCKAFVFPSLYEGFGLPIIEAINHNCIVLSSNAGSLSEFEFKSVQYFNPYNLDQLTALIENINNFSFHTEDKQLLSKYNWDTVFDSYQDNLKKILK